MEKIKDLFQSASIPCISNISKSHLLISKLTWLIGFFLLFAIFVMFARETSLNYFEHEVITNVDIIREEEAEFPTVSFCINQRLNLSQFLDGCIFDMQECNWSDFEVKDFLNETCYRFNSGHNYFGDKIPIKKTSNYDFKTSLMLILSLSNDYLIDGNITPFKTSLFIQNHSTLFVRDHAFNIESGLLVSNGGTFITFEREFVFKLAEPFNHCVKQDTNDYVSDLFQFFISNNMTYLKKDCIDKCIGIFMFENCNISDGNIFSNLDCILKFYYGFRFKEIKIPLHCLKNCPAECDSIKYRIVQNNMAATSLSKSYKLSMNFSDEYANNNLLAIFIHYSSLEYTYSNQIAKMNTFDLISNLGGLLGLFIGMSFVNIIEIIEITFELINHFLYRKYSNKNKSFSINK